MWGDPLPPQGYWEGISPPPRVSIHPAPDKARSKFLGGPEPHLTEFPRVDSATSQVLEHGSWCLWGLKREKRCSPFCRVSNIFLCFAVKPHVYQFPGVFWNGLCVEVFAICFAIIHHHPLISTFPPSDSSFVVMDEWFCPEFCFILPSLCWSNSQMAIFWIRSELPNYSLPGGFYQMVMVFFWGGVNGSFAKHKGSIIW